MSAAYFLLFDIFLNKFSILELEALIFSSTSRRLLQAV